MKSNSCTAKSVKTRPVRAPLGDKEYIQEKVFTIRHANLFFVWFQLQFLCVETKQRDEMDHLVFAVFC